MATTRDETACEPCKHEKQCSILQKLADSINDTARTVRNTSSLVLLAGLYLGLTLVFSTDENLIRDSRIALPQVGVGISLSASYIVAPVIFLYLHFHLLFLLDELKRKIQAFRQAINGLNAEDQAQRWNWLSSSAFVQSFLPCPRQSSKMLVWFSVVALPLMLLFATHHSFVRYQSDWITSLHKIVFLLDLLFIAFFRSECFSYIWNRRGDLAKKVRSIFRKVDPEKPVPNENLEGANRNSDPEASPKQEMSPEKKYISKILKYVKCVMVAVLVSVMAVLVSVVDSPDIDLRNVKKEQNRLWQKNDTENFLTPTVDATQKIDGENVGFLTQIIETIEINYFDAVLCSAWGLICRYLDISNSLPDMHGIDLHSREMRFARFGTTKLDKANFRNADLRGAFLAGTELQDADFSGAQLQGAILENANLQNANVSRAKLQSAYLMTAKLQGADLIGAEFEDTNLELVQLQGADLRFANLVGENLAHVRLQGADLRFAELQGVNLEGANLKGAKLQGANLKGAKLQGANLTGAQFD